MGKKSKNRGGGVSSEMDRIDNRSEVAFRCIDNNALVANVKAIELGIVNHPSTRIVDIGANWNFFRYKKLRIIVHPISSITSSVTSFVASATATAPASLATAAEQVHAVIQTSGSTVPKVIKLNRADLRGPHDWYRCEATTDPYEYRPGYIFVRGGATDGNYTEIEGVIEFKGGVDPAVALERMKTKMLSSLSCASLPKPK